MSSMKTDVITNNIEDLSGLDIRPKNDDFLLTWERTDEEIKATALVAECLMELHRRGSGFKIFESGLAVAIFRDKSTRTRFSFASAMNALGLAVSELDEEKSQISHGETVRETANMISFLTEVIGIRDDVFLGEGNRYMREVAAAVTDSMSRVRPSARDSRGLPVGVMMTAGHC